MADGLFEDEMDPDDETGADGRIDDRDDDHHRRRSNTRRRGRSRKPGKRWPMVVGGVGFAILFLILCVGALRWSYHRTLLADAPEYADDTPFDLARALHLSGADIGGGSTPSMPSVSTGPLLAVLIMLLAVLVLYGLTRIPLPHPGNPFDRDPKRAFTQADREWIRKAAGDRCEHRTFGLFRCRRHGGARDGNGVVHEDWLGDKPGQLDHHYPWAKGGATSRHNLVYLCAKHNNRKSDKTPSWWDTWLLHRARLKYFPPALRGYTWVDGRQDESVSTVDDVDVFDDPESGDAYGLSEGSYSEEEAW